eukprot:TRINITY_DN13043_c0_g1_i1.p1 TRINITY_DN13043_c0_g1~~TRINITY_DN13043_c0_g1_i1.p1  ORF type:complete len:501 (-),score=53.70 TRINITY_DN13043_c0_g1_i1:2117-3619(-)
MLSPEASSLAAKLQPQSGLRLKTKTTSLCWRGVRCKAIVKRMLCVMSQGRKVNAEGLCYGDVAGQKSLFSPSIPKISPQDLGVVLLNIAALLYSGSIGATKDVIETGVSPTVVVALKYLIGGGILVPVLFKQMNLSRLRLPGIRECMALCELGMWLGLGSGAQAMELQTATSTEGSVMLSLYLVMVPLLEVLAGSPISGIQIMSLIGSIVGVGFLNANPAGLEMNAGMAWGLASSLFFALHLFRSERLQKKIDLGSLELGIGQLIVAGMVISAISMGDCGTAQVVSQGMQVIQNMLNGTPEGLLMLTCAFLFTAVPQTVELTAISSVPASQASLILTMMVIWGALEGVILKGETITTFGIFGAVLIIASSILPQLIPNLKLALPDFDKYKNIVQQGSVNFPIQSYTTDDIKEYQDMTLFTATSEFSLASQPATIEKKQEEQYNLFPLLDNYNNVSEDVLNFDGMSDSEEQAQQMLPMSAVDIYSAKQGVETQEVNILSVL